jgi:hypothetical protein
VSANFNGDDGMLLGVALGAALGTTAFGVALGLRLKEELVGALLDLVSGSPLGAPDAPSVSATGMDGFRLGAPLGVVDPATGLVDGDIDGFWLGESEVGLLLSSLDGIPLGSLDGDRVG